MACLHHGIQLHMRRRMARSRGARADCGPHGRALVGLRLSGTTLSLAAAAGTLAGGHSTMMIGLVDSIRAWTAPFRLIAEDVGAT